MRFVLEKDCSLYHQLERPFVVELESGADFVEELVLTRPLKKLLKLAIQKWIEGKTQLPIELEDKCVHKIWCCETEYFNADGFYSGWYNIWDVVKEEVLPIRTWVNDLQEDDLWLTIDVDYEVGW